MAIQRRLSGFSFFNQRQNRGDTDDVNHCRSARKSLPAIAHAEVLPGVKLGSFLEAKANRDSYKDFLQKEHSDENLEFWECIEHFKKMRPSKQLKSSRYIFEK